MGERKDQGTKEQSRYEQLVNRNKMLIKAAAANFKEEMKYKELAFYVDRCESRRRWSLKMADSPYTDDQLSRSKSNQQFCQKALGSQTAFSPDNSLMHTQKAGTQRKRSQSRSLSRSRQLYE